MLEYTKKSAKRIKIGHMVIGSVIFYNDILYMFNRIPQGGKSIYVICLDDMKHYRIPLSNGADTTFDVVGYVQNNVFYPKNDTNDLKLGDLFIINDVEQKGNFMFRFEKYSNDNIIVATNPSNNKEVRISKRFICTKVENLPF